MPAQTKAYVLLVSTGPDSMRSHEYVVWALDERHAARIAAARFPNCVRRIVGSPRLDHQS